MKRLKKKLAETEQENKKYLEIFHKMGLTALEIFTETKRIEDEKKSVKSVGPRAVER